MLPARYDDDDDADQIAIYTVDKSIEAMNFSESVFKNVLDTFCFFPIPSGII